MERSRARIVPPEQGELGPPKLADDRLACPQCDLLQTLPALDLGERAACQRCGCVLKTRPAHGDQVPMALTLSALIAFAIANTSPLMDLSAVGRSASTTIIGGAYDLWQNGQPITAAVVFFCAVLAPAMYLGFMLLVLLAARRPVLPHAYGELLRWGLHMREWSMFEVMLIGILVALIKIASLAAVNPGIGMVGLVALAFLLPAISVSFEPDRVWRRIALDAPQGSAGPPQDSLTPTGGGPGAARPWGPSDDALPVADGPKRSTPVEAAR